MTLVPIIYTSLLIFTAFLFLVILGSYITYRTKKGKKPKAEIVLDKRQNFATPVKVPILQSQAVAVLKSAPVVHKQVNYPTSNVTRRRTPTMERIQVESKNNIRDTRYYNPRNHDAAKVLANREDRVNVISLPSQNKFIERAAATQIQNRASYNKLPDLNLLNYYSEGSDSSFITLTA